MSRPARRAGLVSSTQSPISPAGVGLDGGGYGLITGCTIALARIGTRRP